MSPRSRSRPAHPSRPPSPLSLWLPPAAWMGVIFAASSIPNLTRVPGGFSDTTAHASAYAVLALLFVRALARGSWSAAGARAVGLAFVLSVAYGVTDEWHQRFVEGRTWSLADLAADAAGAAAAAAAAWAWSIIRHFSRSRGEPDGVYHSSPRT